MLLVKNFWPEAHLFARRKRAGCSIFYIWLTAGGRAQYLEIKTAAKTA